MSCIQISLDHWILLIRCVQRMQFWCQSEFALSGPQTLRLKRRGPVACYVFTHFPKWDHLKSDCQGYKENKKSKVLPEKCKGINEGNMVVETFSEREALRMQ